MMSMIHLQGRVGFNFNAEAQRRKGSQSCFDRINKIDRIGDIENPDNPVNPVEKYLHASTRSTRLKNSVNSMPVLGELQYREA